MGNKALPSNSRGYTTLLASRWKRPAHILLLRYSVNSSVAQEERLAVSPSASNSIEAARALNLCCYPHTGKGGPV